MSAANILSHSVPLFSVGAMTFGAFRAYNNFQDTYSTPSSYLGISIATAALQSSVVVIASPTPVGLVILAGATAYQGILQYAAMKAGEQIGIAARTPENRELR